MNVQAIIEERPIGRRQIGIAATVLAALVVDGLDLILLSFVAPLILLEWQIDKASFGVALSAAVFTMAIGAFVGGKAGDRWGRKRVLAVAVFGFAASTFATAFANGLTMLTALRLIGGLGFGAATPNGLALAAEWLPRRARARVASAISIASPLGGIIAGNVALWLLPFGGWRGCFIFSGVVAAVIGLIVLIRLPESPAFDIARGRPDRARASMDAIMGAQGGPIAAPGAPAQPGERLFTRVLARFNAGVGLGFFCCSYVTFALSAWIVVVLTSVGLSYADAAEGLLLFNVFAVLSAFVMPRLLAILGSRWAMAAASLLTVGLLAAIGAAITAATGAADRAILLPACAGLGLSQGLLNALFYAVIARGYPAAVRAGGSGYAMMLNRAGGVAAILTSGLLLRATGGTIAFLATLALAIAGSVAGQAMIDRHQPRRRDDVEEDRA